MTAPMSSGPCQPRRTDPMLPRHTPPEHRLCFGVPPALRVWPLARVALVELAGRRPLSPHPQGPFTVLGVDVVEAELDRAPDLLAVVPDDRGEEVVDAGVLQHLEDHPERGVNHGVDDLAVERHTLELAELFVLGDLLVDDRA